MAGLPHPDDTIAALASAPGPAARGVIRISGPRTGSLLEGWFQPAGGASRPAHNPLPHSLRGEVCVERFVPPVPVERYFWPGQRSFTGQPSAELHLPGSPPLVEAVLEAILRRGARLAHPGEFTMRAFLAGRIDLLQAEAILGIIEARDARELAGALEQLGGNLSSPLVRLRGDLLDLLADLEAGLDFTEEDLQFISRAELCGRIALAQEAVRDLLARTDARLQADARPRVVLTGPPNAGKSALFNRLVGGERALVSSAAGTTRDYLVAQMTVAGLPITLVDTAGAGGSSNPLDAQAQERRIDQLQRADLVLHCCPVDVTESAAIAAESPPVLAVRTKADLLNPHRAQGTEITVSALTGAGLEALQTTIARVLGRRDAGGATLAGTTGARCRDGLHAAWEALDRALALARGAGDEEFLAIELREALAALADLVGAVYTDDLLDRIFSRFCIGK